MFRNLTDIQILSSLA